MGSCRKWTAYPLALPPHVVIVVQANDRSPILHRICKELRINIMLLRRHVPQQANSLERPSVLNGRALKRQADEVVSAHTTNLGKHTNAALPVVRLELSTARLSCGATPFSFGPCGASAYGVAETHWRPPPPVVHPYGSYCQCIHMLFNHTGSTCPLLGWGAPLSMYIVVTGHIRFCGGTPLRAPCNHVDNGGGRSVRCGGGEGLLEIFVGLAWVAIILCATTENRLICPGCSRGQHRNYHCQVVAMYKQWDRLHDA